MSSVSLLMSESEWTSTRAHVLSGPDGAEDAAFLFVKPEVHGSEIRLRHLETFLVPPDGHRHQSPYYLELAEHIRPYVIKRAHDLGASLVEIHSHPMQEPARFSWSDLHGFDECVPHFLWRLSGRPYTAIVVAPTSIDALVWTTSVSTRLPLNRLFAGDREVIPTGLTLADWSDIYDQQPI